MGMEVLAGMNLKQRLKYIWTYETPACILSLILLPLSLPYFLTCTSFLGAVGTVEDYKVYRYKSVFDTKGIEVDKDHFRPLVK